MLHTARALQRACGVEPLPAGSTNGRSAARSSTAIPIESGGADSGIRRASCSSSGHGAVLAAESGVRDGEFLVAIDVQAGRRGEGAEAKIRMASLVEREWLVPSHTETVHEFDRESGRVRAFRRESYGALVLAEHRSHSIPERLPPSCARLMPTRGWSDADEQLARRLRFAAMALEMPALLERATAGRTGWTDIDLAAHLTWEERQRVDRDAPLRLAVPSGRSHAIDYHADGTVVGIRQAAGALRVGRDAARRPAAGASPPLLLAPNGRPVQTHA